jgi:hypothetical protein
MQQEMILQPLQESILGSCTEDGCRKQEYNFQEREKLRSILEEAIMVKELQNGYRLPLDQIRLRFRFTLIEKYLIIL